MATIRDTEIMSLAVGDIIYECEMGMNLEARVTTAPIEEEGFEGRKKWSWTAKNTQNGQEINYLITEGMSHYGPRLYREPQYCGFANGEITFPLVGAQEKSDA